MAQFSALLLLLTPTSGFRAPRKDDPEVAPAGVAPGRGTIGVGYDVPRSDLWSFRGNYIRQFYSDDMPDSCFQEDPCPHTTEKRSYDFTSVKKWSQKYSSHFGIELSGGYKGFKGSITASIGKDFENTWSNERNVSWYYVAKTQKCYQLLASCATNPDYLAPRVRSMLNSLPQNGTDAQTMTVWKLAFLQNFGTHIAVKSSHGALLQGTASADRSCKMSSACRNSEGCLKMSFLEYVDLSLCANISECKNTESCRSTFQTSCVAVGGDPSFTAPQLCNSDNTEEIDQFLRGGDLTDSSSRISLTFRPVYEILMQMGFWQQGLVVMKADDYYTCHSPQRAWLPAGAANDHECQCVLECQNGGSLDPSACTCTCRADDDHGWTGGDCSEDFGKCVRGVGSSGTPTARGRACVEGNVCAGIERSDVCGNTDVCCNRDEGGLCCPWGSTCNCFALGKRFCQCVPP